MGQLFSQKVLIFLGQGETKSFLFYLLINRFIYLCFTVTQDDGPVTAEKIDKIISVNIGEAAALA